MCEITKDEFLHGKETCTVASRTDNPKPSAAEFTTKAVCGNRAKKKPSQKTLQKTGIECE